MAAADAEEALYAAVAARDGRRASALMKSSVRRAAENAAAAATSAAAAGHAPPRGEEPAAAADVRRRVRERCSRGGGGRAISADVAACLAEHAACVASLHAQAYAHAYANTCASLSAAMRAWREHPDEDENVGGALHLNSLLWALASNVRFIAELADREMTRRGAAPTTLSDAAGVLRKAFADAQKAGGAAKKQAALEFVNQLFCIFFRLNTLGQCKHLMRTVDQKTFPPFRIFPASHRVTYSYYAGRLCVFYDEWDGAMRNLTYALRHCAARQAGNKRRILQYLIPVRMLGGVLPSPVLLSKYGLDAEFAGVVRAIRSGDLRAFKRCMDENFFGLVRSGTYLLMEKMRMLVYRTALKRVFELRARAGVSAPHQMRLEIFRHVLKWMDDDLMADATSLDEVECVVANLIYRKYVKGYISHQKRVLVVSKQEAFSPIANVPIPGS